MVRTSVATMEQIVHVLLQLPSYAQSYLLTLSLHGQLYGVYTQQVQSIGGATLHPMAMAHQRNLNWAAMVVYCMQAHS